MGKKLFNAHITSREDKAASYLLDLHLFLLNNLHQRRLLLQPLSLINVRKLTMEELGRLSVDDFKNTDKIPVTVVLDNVRSMHNVGSIFRTSDAFLIEKIILCGFTPKPPHRDINKTALGATETVAWEYMDSTEMALQELKHRGYWIAAVEQASESVMLPDVVLPENMPVCVVFGNEVDGVDEIVLTLCDAAIEIPQMGMKHSLNVSVAAGIVLYRLAELSGQINT